MEGWWHDCGLIMMLVLVGFRWILLSIVPSSASDVGVKECDGIIFLNFSCDLDSGVDFV